MEWVVTVVGILLVTVVVRDMFRTLVHPVGHGSIAPHAVRTARRKRWVTPLPLMAASTNRDQSRGDVVI